MLVYDVTNDSSFAGLEDWMKDVHEKADENAVLCVCGNKIDMKDQLEVDLGEARHYAEVSSTLYLIQKIPLLNRVWHDLLT